jgi:hypothetical protein
MQPLLNLDGTPQRWTDGIPPDELAAVADELGVTVEAILADENLQILADARHFDWLARNGRLTGSREFVDYCTN